VQQNFVSAQYQPDIYVAFMERACLLSNQGGFQSLIVPTTFLTMHYFSAIRRFLLNHCRIDTLVHFKFPVFEDPTVESAIYICQHEPNETRRQSNTVRGIIVTSLEKFTTKGFDIQTIPQLRFEEIPENDFNISLDSQSSSIISKVGSDLTESLGIICDIVCGLTPYRLGKGNPPQSKEIVENRMFDATYPKDKTYHKYLMGRDFNRYVIAPLEERWISYGEWLAEPRWAAPFFEPQKIIVRQTGDSIIATIDNQQFVNLKNVHNLRLKTPFPNYEYLLAVLNSRVITYFHQQLVPEADRVFAEVKIVDLERLPIRRIYFTTPKDERERQVAELKSFYEVSDYDGILTRIDELLPKDADGAFLAFARSISVKDAIAKGYMTKQVEHPDLSRQRRGEVGDAENSALKEDSPSGYDESGNPLEKSDVVHDFLSFLAEQMTTMNKSKCEQIKRFWTDLEGITDADTFAKLQKGKQEKGLARKKLLRQFVNPESASNKGLEDALEWTEEAFKEFVKTLAGRILNLSDLLDVYRKYASVVQTLAQRIQATDELIDGVVYRLYGLTEEEIKIVEESVKGKRNA
jgi:hypothetical protein